MERSRDIRQSKAFLTFLLVVYGVAFIGYLGARRGLHGWYDVLLQPAGTPAPWVFGPVWTVLYILIGYSGWQLWMCEAGKARTRALFYYWVQLALNSAWCWLFFGFQKPLPAFLELVALWVSILLTILAALKVKKQAAWLLLPYLLWVTYAGYLNFGIWNLNYRNPKADGHVEIVVGP